MMRSILVAMVAWLGLMPLAAAEVLVTYVANGQAHFRIAVPDQWLIRTGVAPDPAAMPDGIPPMPPIVSAMPEDGEILWLGFWVPDEVDDLDQAQAYLTSLEGFLLQEPEVAEITDGEINGLPMRVVRGSGLTEGQPMAFTVGLFQVAEATVAIAILIGNPKARAAHQQELQTILDSLTPVAP